MGGKEDKQKKPIKRLTKKQKKALFIQHGGDEIDIAEEVRGGSYTLIRSRGRIGENTGNERKVSYWNSWRTRVTQGKNLVNLQHALLHKFSLYKKQQ